MLRDAILGVDVGTSGVKVAAFDIAGRTLAAHTVALAVEHPRPRWAQQSADGYWTAVCEALRAVLAIVRPERIVGVGVDGQSWSCIPIDEFGEVLAPNPIWMDTRSADIASAIESAHGERILRVSGNPFHATHTTPKVLWFREHMPDVYRRTRWFLQSNAFIVYRLTGVATFDLSQGYGVHAFDMTTGAYDEPLAEAIGLDLSRMPPISASHDIVGDVTRQAADATGLLPGTPVVAGGLDASCGTLGLGVIRPGQTQEQSGQSGGMGICVDRPLADRRLILGQHVVPGTWLLQGGTVAGGGALRWFSGLFDHAMSYDALCAEAARIPPGAEGLWFLPYLQGERSPIWDAHASGVFFGLGYAKTRAHMTRSVLEGCAYALRHCLDAAAEVGAHVSEMVSMGGGAKSALWQQIKADVTGCTLHVPENDAATSLGAALLVGVGTGLYRDFEDAVARTVRIRASTEPGEARTAYQKRYPLYLELYERLKDTMHRAGTIE